MSRPLETTLEHLFALAEQKGKAVIWLSHGLCIEAYTEDRKGVAVGDSLRTLVLKRQQGNPSMQEAHTCAKYAHFENYGVVAMDKQICVFEWRMA